MDVCSLSKGRSHSQLCFNPNMHTMHGIGEISRVRETNPPPKIIVHRRRFACDDLAIQRYGKVHQSLIGTPTIQNHVVLSLPACVEFLFIINRTVVPSYQVRPDMAEVTYWRVIAGDTILVFFHSRAAVSITSQLQAALCYQPSKHQYHQIRHSTSLRMIY